MSNFHFEETFLEGVCIITPLVYRDDRGCFMETYQKHVFTQNGIAEEFVQDNYSRSSKGTIRGIGFQKKHTQGKLIRVISGSIYDVAVDVRPGSKSFGKHLGIVLSAENKKMIWIPKGFAHGFLALEDASEIIYKCTDVYDPESEGGIVWNDSRLGIAWPCIEEGYIINGRDKDYPSFEKQDFQWANEYLR